MKRLFQEKHGRHTAVLAADGGAVDVVLYWGKSVQTLKPVVPPDGCSLGTARFHLGVDGLLPGTNGLQLSVIEERRAYLIIARWTDLNPPRSKDGVIVMVEGTTDSIRVKK